MASKSRRNKTKFKWTKELIILICCLVAMIAATIVFQIPSKATRQLEGINEKITEYNTANETSYSTLSEKHHFKEITYDGLCSQKNSSGYTYVWYGSTSNGTFLELLTSLNNAAEIYDVETIYLFYSTYVDDATANEETNSSSYKKTLNDMQEKLNENKAKDIAKFELENYPALLVFHDGSLVFNSQLDTDSSEYNWNIYINKAFGLEKL